MRRSPDYQSIRRPQINERSQKGTRSVWKKSLPGLSLIAVLAATVCALYGSGQIPDISAAGSHSGAQRVNPEAESALAARHRRQLQTGCTLIVPANPLTATGLATPYQLTGNSRSAACHEATATDSAFVQAAVLDPATGQISVYNPLVIDRGKHAAATPVVPKLPANAVVGIWFGSNANGLRLSGARFDTLARANCVNGLGSSVFGQVAFCNATAFFHTANQLIAAKKLTPPPLGTARDGLTCPTVRDFSVVDQDQSDNVVTSYLITQGGDMAQNTSANAAKFTDSAVLGNGSDNGLLSIALDGALGCSAWRAPDLADPGQLIPAQPLDELQAAMYQSNPAALVPSGDPMTLVNGRPNLVKQNRYRLGVDQPTVNSARQAQAQQVAYCRDVMNIAPTQIERDRAWTAAATSPDAATANSLFTFLAARLSFTVGSDGLNCTGMLRQANPVHLVQNSDGVVIDATFTVPSTQANATPSSNAGA